MTPLDQYLTGPYVEDKREVDRVQRLLAEVWPLFTANQVWHHTHGWPYEVINGRQPWVPRPPADRKYSLSTNSMIVFAMAAASGAMRHSVLVPAVRCELDLARGSAGTFDVKEFHKRFNDAAAQFVHQVEGNGYTFESDSFGRNDPFTLAWVCEMNANARGFAEHAADGDAFRRGLVGAAWSTCRRLAEFRTLDLGEPNSQDNGHTFPLLRSIQLYRILQSKYGRELRAGRRMRAEQSLRSLRPQLLGRLHEHLSLAEIPHSAFDPAELVFSLEAVFLTDEDARSVDRNLIDRVFEVMRKNQQHSPYWRPAKPMIVNERGFGLLPLSVEIANSLLRICEHLVEWSERRYFSQHLDVFRQYADWLHTRVTRITSAGEKFTGWHSEHTHGADNIHTWETAQVALFLMHYGAMLQEHVAHTTLRLANFAVTKPTRKPGLAGEPPPDYWDKSWASTEPVRDLPVLAEIGAEYLGSRDEEGEPAGATETPYSLLLYGPPGTAKTTLAEELANSLDWPLITITPSNFVASGEGEVEARASSIFKALGEQRRAVILFDEIDRLILDRDSMMYREQGDVFQFMTPSMLVKLRDLRKAERSIFIVATNYDERIDPAAKRTGRIDHRYLVAPPDRAARERIILGEARAKLAKRLASQGRADTIVDSLAGALVAPVVAATVLATFNELKELVRVAVSRFEKVGPRPARRLAAWLAQVWAEQKPPAIRLAAYRNRFHLDATETDFPTAQEPFTEFLLLVYLRREAGMLDGGDRALFLNVVWHGATGETGTVPDWTKAGVGDRAKGLIREAVPRRHTATIADSLVQELESVLAGGAP